MLLWVWKSKEAKKSIKIESIFKLKTSLFQKPDFLQNRGGYQSVGKYVKNRYTIWLVVCIASFRDFPFYLQVVRQRDCLFKFWDFSEIWLKWLWKEAGEVYLLLICLCILSEHQIEYTFTFILISNSFRSATKVYRWLWLCKSRKKCCIKIAITWFSWRRT